jgi:hypothetical protein
MSEYFGHKSKVKTEVLRTVDFDIKYRLTIEKILDGKFKNQYVVRSYTKSFFGYKLSSLAAWNVLSDDDHNYIESYEFKPFRMLKQALDFAKDVKKNRLTNWVKYQ